MYTSMAFYLCNRLIAISDEGTCAVQISVCLANQVRVQGVGIEYVAHM